MTTILRGLLVLIGLLAWQLPHGPEPAAALAGCSSACATFSLEGAPKPGPSRAIAVAEASSQAPSDDGLTPHQPVASGSPDLPSRLNLPRQEGGAVPADPARLDRPPKLV